MKVGVSLRSGYGPMDVRTGAQWLVERTRAARDAGLDSLFIGDHHNVPDGSRLQGIRRRIGCLLREPALRRIGHPS